MVCAAVIVPVAPEVPPVAVADTAKWAEQYTTTGASSADDGAYNTQAIMAYRDAHGGSYPAAEACVDYRGGGMTTGFYPLLIS